ncbi:MAG TPA: HlyD family efflux transporter periplasmic adaptor subunit [Terrimicrobiaceae bacterium]
MGLLVLGGAVAVILIGALSGLLDKPIAVETGRVTRGPLVVAVQEEGKTRIRDRYVVSATVGGYLRRVPVRPGDEVVAGHTLLATIQPASAGFLDPRALAQAKAAVQSAEAACMQRNEEVNRSASELDLGQRELSRAQKLKEKGAIALQAFDLAANRVEVLADQLASARFALQVAQYQLEQAKAALVHFEEESGESRLMELRSPVTGCVLNVFEESARVVAADTPILEVGDPADLEAEVELLSSDAVNVKPGADVSIEQWGGNAPLRGRVILVEPGAFLKVSALGVEEQRVKVRVRFVNLPSNVLGDRYRIQARITIWSGENILQVPTAALFRHGNNWATFVVDHGRAKRTILEIDHNNGETAEVKSGLAEGQMVILYPADSIEDGVAVKAVPEPPSR